MSNRLAAVLVLISLLIMTHCGGSFRRAGTGEDAIGALRVQLSELFSEPSFASAFWGVLVRSVDTGETIYAHNEHRSFVPASNMKLFTTAAALQELGPEFRYVTAVYAPGPPDGDGTLRGPVIVAGSGDPTISGRFHGGNITATFEDWADSLMVRGVRAIRGDIVGDDDIFDDQALGSGWSWDYQTQWYAAQVSGLSFNDNCMDVSVEPGENSGQPAEVDLEPETSYVTVHNQLMTCRSSQQEDWDIHRQPLSNLVKIRGTIPQGGQGYQGWFTVHNPTLFTVTVFREVLAARGISVSGEALDIDEMDKGPLIGYTDRWTRIATAASPTLADIITVVNKRSQNFYAEQLLKTLGARVRGQGSVSEGAEVVKAALRKMGVSPDCLVMADGSGLSRHNFVCPETVVALLEQMARHDRFPQFRDSLPLAGIDGTLSERMVGTTAQGRVMAKTGSLDRVRSLSGYALSRDDELFVFSMMINNHSVPDQAAEELQDRACQLLTAFSRSGK